MSRRCKVEGLRRCPKCRLLYEGYPAVSRRDNKTEICPNCGRAEAVEDYVNWRREEEAKGEGH